MSSYIEVLTSFRYTMSFIYQFNFILKLTYPFLGDIGDFTTISNQLGLIVKPTTTVNETPELKKPLETCQTHSKTGIFSAELSKLADLSLNPSNSSPNRKKITKEDFNTTKGLKHDSNPNDPLSQLDPLWSLK